MKTKLIQHSVYYINTWLVLYIILTMLWDKSISCMFVDIYKDHVWSLKQKHSWRDEKRRLNLHAYYVSMMTSSNGNIFRVTGHLCGNSPGTLILYPWWHHQMETFSALLAICAGIHRSPVNFPHKGQWRGALMFSLICTRLNGWENNGEAGDFRRHRAHYDVTAMYNVGT